MIVWMISSEPPNIFLLDLLWCCIIMRRSVLWKNCLTTVCSELTVKLPLPFWYQRVHENMWFGLDTGRSSLVFLTSSSLALDTVPYFDFLFPQWLHRERDRALRIAAGVFAARVLPCIRCTATAARGEPGSTQQAAVLRGWHRERDADRQAHQSQGMLWFVSVDVEWKQWRLILLTLLQFFFTWCWHWWWSFVVD